MRLVSIAPNPSIDRQYDLDRLRIGAINRPLGETRVAGGKGLNVARAAAALGADVTAIALLAGHAGRWIADALADEGIRTRPAWCDGETRSCFAIHDGEDDSLTELNEAGPTVDAAAWEGFVDTLRAELFDVAVGAIGLVTLSGSLPPGAPVDGVAQLVAATGAAGVPIAVDCSGEPLRRALTERPTIVKLNVAEAAATLAGAESGGTAELMALSLARELTVRTGGTTIVTLGLDGAVAAAPDGRLVRVSAPPLRGRYPVGSGDAFMAGVATALLRGDSFDAMLRLGAAAATANALRRGAGRLEPARVDELFATTFVEPIGSF